MKQPTNICIIRKDAENLKGLLHYISTCIEITGNNWLCLILKNVKNCKENFQRVKKVKRNLNFNWLKICKDSYSYRLIQIIIPPTFMPRGI